LKITEKEVRYVANLGNVRLTDEEIPRMAKDLEEILTYIDKPTRRQRFVKTSSALRSAPRPH
jgi:Asp-tRNA(Asn)/Glu-tRNA(Gln) amidotransferase C subunit